jgi:hypothetical protein
MLEIAHDTHFWQEKVNLEKDNEEKEKLKWRA